jgi:hypothetical protein
VAPPAPDRAALPRAAAPRRAGLGVELLLRGEGVHAVGGGRVPVARLLLIVAVCGGCYGAVMGGCALNAEQMLYSALKVPLLLVVSALVCLPNFYVLNAVLGLSGDFAAALRGILSAQATLAVTLAALSPITAFLYVCGDHYEFFKLLNGAMFAVGSLAAQRTLARHYAPLLARNRRHRRALLGWPLLYVFVAMQLAYVLRPFVGNPALPTTFLRETWWGNVYVDLAWALRGL